MLKTPSMASSRRCRGQRVLTNGSGFRISAPSFAACALPDIVYIINGLMPFGWTNEERPFRFGSQSIFSNGAGVRPKSCLPAVGRKTNPRIVSTSPAKPLA